MSLLSAVRRIVFKGESDAEALKAEGLKAEHRDDLRYVYAMLDEARRYKDDKGAKDWPTFKRYVEGKQWRTGGTEGKGRVRISQNEIAPILDHKIGIMTASQPRIFIQSMDETQPNAAIGADLHEKAIQAEWEREDAQGKIGEALHFGGTFGRAETKVYFDPMLNWPKGGIRIDAVRPQDLFVDPNATTESDAAYIIQVGPVEIDDLVARYGKIALGVRPDLTFPSVEKLRSAEPATTRGPNEGTTPSDSQGDMARRRVIRIEAWFRDSQIVEVELPNGDIAEVYRYPYGRKMVIAGGLKLSDAPVRYPWWPYCGMPYYWRGGSFWGVTEVEHLRPTQDALNSTITNFVKGIRLMAEPQWVLDRGSGVKSENLSGEPGLIIWKNPQTEARKEEGKAPPPQVLEAIRDARMEMRQLSGLTDLMAGRGKLTHTPGSAVQQQTAQGYVRLIWQLGKLNRMIQEMGERMLWIIQNLYTEPRTFLVPTGEDSAPEPVTFNPSEYSGHRFKLSVSVGSTLPAAKGARFSEAVLLKKMGVIDDEDVLEKADWPNRVKVLQRMAKAKQQAPPQKPMGKNKGGKGSSVTPAEAKLLDT